MLLPAVEHINLTASLRDVDFSRTDGTCTYSARLPWALITSAKWGFTAVYELAMLHRVQHNKCFNQLHVCDVPAAWQQSLARPSSSWRCSLNGWNSVSGMPSAMSRTTDGFEVQKQRTPADA